MDEQFLESIYETFSKNDLVRIVLGLSSEIQQLKAEIFRLEDDILVLKRSLMVQV
ncbi:MAG: hypothetical protein ACTSRW_10145 [Candidatus Helarchaeota archaeon]